MEISILYHWTMKAWCFGILKTMSEFLKGDNFLCHGSEYSLNVRYMLLRRVHFCKLLPRHYRCTEHMTKRDILIACMFQYHLLLFTNRNLLTYWSLHFQHVFPSGLAAIFYDHTEQNGGFHSAKSTFQMASLQMTLHTHPYSSFWSSALLTPHPNTLLLICNLQCTLLSSLSKTLALQPPSD